MDLSNFKHIHVCPCWLAPSPTVPHSNTSPLDVPASDRSPLTANATQRGNEGTGLSTEEEAGRPRVEAATDGRPEPRYLDVKS